MNKSKGIIRAGNRSGTASGKTKPVERASGRPAEPTVCERCGAIFSRRVWQRGRVMTTALLERAVWRQCPACKQVRDGEYWGRVIVRGAFAVANDELTLTASGGTINRYTFRFECIGTGSFSEYLTLRDNATQLETPYTREPTDPGRRCK